MRTTTRQGLRLATGTGVMTALLLGMGGVLSAPVALTATSTDSSSDPNAGGVARPEFGGYVGYLGEGGASSLEAATRDRKKPADPTLADPATTRGVDVPGQPVTPVPDLASMKLPTAPDPARVAEVSAAVAEDGTARVIVMTRVNQRLEAKLHGSALRTQRLSIAASLAQLQASLRGTGARRLSQLQSVPSAVYQVNPAALETLLANPEVVSVALDGTVQGELASSTQVIQSTQLNTAGVLGNGFEGGPGGYQVAIIDSGVDNQHNAFTGRIVSQACSVTDNSCPGGTNFTTAAGSADECTHSNDCDHGTHVGSIAAGETFAGGHEGVARGAGIVAVKVAQDNPGSSRWTAQFSAIDTALQHVLNLRNGPFPRLAAVNLSIGTQSVFGPGDANCNAVDPTTGALFGQLQAAGVAVLVAAGNNGSNAAMSFPGCAPNAMAIGATDDSDVPAGFTNSSAGLRWWAPGVNIDAAVPTGDNHGTKDGTSMATPHVVGAFALLRECVDGNGNPITNAAAAGNLDATGVDVTRNGVTRKRINVLDAATRTVNNNDFADAESFAGNGPVDDFDFNVCSDTEAGEPGPFSIDNGIWWNWTPATTGTATISTEDGGGFATTFDTTLAVYTGNAIGSLTTIAADDDSGTGNRSLVTFPVNGGTTYRIKVDGFGASTGLLNLHIENGAPPDCLGVPATVVGTAGNDALVGTDGDDVVVLGAGDDDYYGGLGNDRICGDAGDDLLRGGVGQDLILGGSGSDTIVGGADDDVLVGNPGSGSNDDAGDQIRGGSGNDFLDGWFGNDTLEGGPGDDQIRGEAGTDRVVYDLAGSKVKANLGAGKASGGAGTDVLVLIENLTGSAFNDLLTGSSGVNSISGGNGRDTVNGAGGNDSIRGNAGRDNLRGQGGNDHVSGGPSRDRCNGGTGVDAASSCEVKVGFP
jgi:hypothetical protein